MGEGPSVAFLSSSSLESAPKIFLNLILRQNQNHHQNIPPQSVSVHSSSIWQLIGEESHRWQPITGRPHRWQPIRGGSHMAANQRCIWQMAANLKQCPLARQALSYLYFSGYYTDLILLLFRPNQLSSLRLSPVPHSLWTSLFQGELTTIGAYVQNKNGEFQLATLP